MTADVTGTVSQVESFELRLNGASLNTFGALVAAALAVQVFAVPWPAKLAPLTLLIFGGSVLLIRAVRSQEVRLTSDRIELQLGFGPAIVFPFEAIVGAKEQTREFGRVRRFMYSGAPFMDQPNLVLTLKRRMFRVGWIPLPIPAYSKSQWLPVWETTRLLEELQDRVPRLRSGWIMPNPGSDSLPPA